MTGVPVEPDRWHRIEDLFHAAIDLPDEQRAEFVRQSCGADAGLRQELESLLAAGDQESPLIAGIVDEATASLLEEDEQSSG